VSLKRIAVVSALVLGPLIHSASAQEGIAGSLCDVGKRVLLGQTFSFREQQVPIDMARSAMDNFAANYPTFWQFMVGSVNTVYSDPDDIRAALGDGRWRKLCVEAVRGY
jgi:hypothetical protein